jgi:DNA-binding transcriptional LysR family regulator
MLNTREIEAFLAVAAELHFGRAAERLHLTTSSVSQAVRALERRIGTPLFERTSRTVRLTASGEELLLQLGPAYERLGEILRQARLTAATVPATLTVGFSSSLVPGMQQVLIDAFENKSLENKSVENRAAENGVPGNHVVAISVNPIDLFLWDKRVGGSLDAIVGWLPPGAGTSPAPDLTAGPSIRTCGPGLLMAERHPLAHRAAVDIEELADLEVLLANGVARLTVPWVPAVTPSGRAIKRIRRDMWYIENMMSVIAHSRLVHITIIDFGRTLPLTGLTLVPLTGRSPFECRVVWPTARETPAIRDFAHAAARAGRAAGWLDAAAAKSR